MGQLNQLLIIAVVHHERLGGSVCWKQFKGEEIGSQTRISGLIDISDSLITSNRPNRAKSVAREMLLLLFVYSSKLGR